MGRNKDQLQIVNEDEIDLREVLLLLWRNKVLIAASSFGFALVAALISVFYLTPQYESTAVIMEAKDQSAASNFRGLGEASPFAALMSLGGPGQTMVRYNEILASRQIAVEVTDELNLMERLSVSIDPSEERALEKAQERIINQVRSAATISAENDVLRLSFRHSDPQLAKDLADTYLSKLQQLIRENLNTQARQTEIFIAERLMEVEQNLREKEAQYVQLKKEEGIVQLPSQINFSLGTASQLRSQIIEKDMQIELYRNIMRDSSEVQRLEEEKQQIEAQLRRLVEGSGASKQDKERLVNVFAPLKDSSSLEVQFANAERNYLIHVKLAELLRQQLEMARIETKKSEPVFQIIDPPVEGLFPVSPNKRLNTVLGFLLGMILSTFMVLVLNQFSGLPRTITRIVKVDVQEKKSEGAQRPFQKPQAFS